ncbi:hypothetical protein GCM10010136_32160 [Limoniibacter endophyticus]|uniref:Uncharacterized protein n=1 Tax=Limoniibacter endophyticus TaxID=1565040 RepID=A0A8J3DL86_9HYPH|nr:hypothetical protein GCM10010136_32160 [Limoniibacter endophyticus]
MILKPIRYWLASLILSLGNLLASPKHSRRFAFALAACVAAIALTVAYSASAEMGLIARPARTHLANPVAW